MPHSSEILQLIKVNGSAVLRTFNEYLSAVHEHLHLPDNINFENLRLIDFRSDDIDSTVIFMKICFDATVILFYFNLIFTLPCTGRYKYNRLV